MTRTIGLSQKQNDSLLFACGGRGGACSAEILAKACPVDGGCPSVLYAPPVYAIAANVAGIEPAREGCTKERSE